MPAISCGATAGAGRGSMLTARQRQRRLITRRAVSIEPRPAPAVAPQLIAGMATLAVLHHDEPALQSLGMADSACRHLSCRCLKHLLYEHGAVGETSVRAIGGDGPGRCIDDVELL